MGEIRSVFPGTTVYSGTAQPGASPGVLGSVNNLLSDPNFIQLLAGIGASLDPQGLGGRLGAVATQLSRNTSAQSAAGQVLAQDQLTPLQLTPDGTPGPTGAKMNDKGVLSVQYDTPESVQLRGQEAAASLGAPGPITETTLPTQAAPAAQAPPVRPRLSANPQRAELASYARSVALEEGVPPQLLPDFLANIEVESSWNPRATGPEVKGGRAKGLGQLMDATAQKYGVTNPYDIDQNIRGNARYWKDLAKRYGNNPTLITAAYNAGEGAVDQYKGVPPYPETQAHVRRVAAARGQYVQPAAPGETPVAAPGPVSDPGDPTARKSPLILPAGPVEPYASEMPRQAVSQAGRYLVQNTPALTAKDLRGLDPQTVLGLVDASQRQRQLNLQAANMLMGDQRQAEQYARAQSKEVDTARIQAARQLADAWLSPDNKRVLQQELNTATTLSRIGQIEAALGVVGKMPNAGTERDAVAEEMFTGRYYDLSAEQKARVNLELENRRPAQESIITTNAGSFQVIRGQMRPLGAPGSAPLAFTPGQGTLPAQPGPGLPGSPQPPTPQTFTQEMTLETEEERQRRITGKEVTPEERLAVGFLNRAWRAHLDMLKYEQDPQNRARIGELMTGWKTALETVGDSNVGMTVGAVSGLLSGGVPGAAVGGIAGVTLAPALSSFVGTLRTQEEKEYIESTLAFVVAQRRREAGANFTVAEMREPLRSFAPPSGTLPEHFPTYSRRREEALRDIRDVARAPAREYTPTPLGPYTPPVAAAPPTGVGQTVKDVGRVVTGAETAIRTGVAQAGEAVGSAATAATAPVKGFIAGMSAEMYKHKVDGYRRNLQVTGKLSEEQIAKFPAADQKIIRELQAELFPSGGNQKQK